MPPRRVTRRWPPAGEADEDQRHAVAVGRPATTATVSGMNFPGVSLTRISNRTPTAAGESMAGRSHSDQSLEAEEGSRDGVDSEPSNSRRSTGRTTPVGPVSYPGAKPPPLTSVPIRANEVGLGAGTVVGVLLLAAYGKRRGNVRRERWARRPEAALPMILGGRRSAITVGRLKPRLDQFALGRLQVLEER